MRPARMPKFEELPMPAQNEIRQARGEPAPEHPQKNRLSLLQRLANVGLGRRDEETEPPIAARASGPAMPPCRDAARAAAAGADAAASGSATAPGRSGVRVRAPLAAAGP